MQSSRLSAEEYTQRDSLLQEQFIVAEESGEETTERRVGKLVNLVQSSLDSEYSRMSHFGRQQHQQSHSNLKGGVDVIRVEKLHSAMATIMSCRSMMEVALKSLV